MHQWSIFKIFLLYVTGFVNPAASGFLNNVICFVKSGNSVVVCNTTLSLCDTGVVTQISTDIKYSDKPASTQCTSPCTIPSNATANRSDILDHCNGTNVCKVNSTRISENNGGALVFNVTCGASTITSRLSTTSSRSPSTVPTTTDSGLSASSQATNPSSTVSNANSSGPNTSSPGPNASSTVSSESSTGPKTSTSGPNVSSTGPNTSSTGPNTSSTGPTASSTVSNESSTGPNTSSPGPNVSSTRPNTSSTGPTASSTGLNASSSSTGPNASSTGPNTSSTGPTANSTVSNESSTVPNTSSTVPNASSTGPNASSTASVADSTTAASLDNESTQAQFSTDSDDPVPAAIAVSVVVSVIIVVLVVAFLMYRKGQCKQLLGKCAKDHRKHSPDRSDELVMGSMANANLTYDLSSVVDLNNYNEDYSEIDMVDKEQFFEYSQVNLKRKQPVHSLTYNHIGHFDRSSEDTEHTYNHFGDETCPIFGSSTLQPDTYSHVGAMARPAFGHLAEDSYAHINGVMKDLPAAYETNQYDCAVFHSNGGQTGHSGHRGNEIQSGKENKFIMVGPSKMDINSDASVSHSYFVLEKHEKEA